MPSALVKKIASTGHLSVADVEKRWNAIKAGLHDEGKKEDDKDFYRNLVGRLKNSLTSSHRKALGWSRHQKKKTSESLASYHLSLLEQSQGRNLYYPLDDDEEYDYYDIDPSQYHGMTDIAALEREFQQENPSLLQQLRKAMDQKDYGFLLKKLAVGSFWSAALIAQPYIIGGGLLLQQYSKHKDREQKRQDYLHGYGY